MSTIQPPPHAISDAQCSQIINMLAAALRPDLAVRTAAEQQLQQARYLEGFGAALTRVVVSSGSNVPADIRQLGALVLKQYIKERWVHHGDHAHHASDAEKQAMRAMLPSGLMLVERKVRTAVGMAIAEIAKHELPSGWPDLVPQLMGAVTQGRDPNAMEGALRCLSLFVDELEEQQIIQLCTALLPPLVELLSAPHNASGPYTHLQRKALGMLRSILVASQHMDTGTKELMGALWSTYLPATMRTLQQRITQPIRIGDADDYGIKQQCLAIAMHLLSDLDRGLVEPYAEGIVGASWHLMQQALPLMVKHEIDVDEEDVLAVGAADADDGDLLTLEAIVAQLFELLLMIVSCAAYQPLLKPYLQPLLYHCLAFMSMTAEQAHRWLTDANEFIADAEDDMSSVRVSAALFVDELVLTFGNDALEALRTVFHRRLEESAAARAAGSEYWWKGREAVCECLCVLGDVLCEAAQDGETLPLDGAALIGKLLREDLGGGETAPLLLARVLWASGRLIDVLPAETLTPLAPAAVMHLGTQFPLPVRVGACKTVVGLAQRAPETLKPHVHSMYAGIASMMDSSGDECVHLALEVIPDLVSVDAGAAAAVCGHLAPRVLALWGVNMRDPMLGEACMDALEAFAKLPSCNPQLEAAVVPTVLPLLDAHTAAQGNVDAASTLANALALLALVLKHADAEAAQRLGAGLMPRLLALADGCTDPSVGQEVSDTLRALLRAGGRSLLSWEGCLGPELPSRLAAVCTRLLQLPDTSGAFVWRLLLQMLATMPQELGPHLEAISTAAAQQLQQGSPIMQQGLICFFAMLLTIDPGQTFAFLQQRTLPGTQQTLLECVLQVWVARQGDFSRPQELKLTCSALGGLLNATDPALDSMTTAGTRLDSPQPRVRTRRQAAATPPQYPTVTMRTKLLMLLADVLVQAAADDCAASASDEDDDLCGLYRSPRGGGLDVTGYDASDDADSVGIPDVAPGSTVRQAVTSPLHQLAGQHRDMLMALGQHLTPAQQRAVEFAMACGPRT